MGEKIQPRDGNEGAAAGVRFLLRAVVIVVGWPGRVYRRWRFKRAELRKLLERIYEMKVSAAYGHLRRAQIVDGIQKLTAEKDATRKRLDELATAHEKKDREEKEKLKKEDEGITGALDAVKGLSRQIAADITGNMQSEGQLIERMAFIAANFSVWRDDPLPRPKTEEEKAADKQETTVDNPAQ